MAIAPYTSPMGRIIRPMRDISSLIVQAPSQADLAEGSRSGAQRYAHFAVSAPVRRTISGS